MVDAGFTPAFRCNIELCQTEYSVFCIRLIRGCWDTWFFLMLQVETKQQ